MVEQSARGTRENHLRRLAALTAVAVLSIAVYWTLRLAIADQLFRSKSLPALGRAVRLAPANAQY